MIQTSRMPNLILTINCRLLTYVSFVTNVHLPHQAAICEGVFKLVNKCNTFCCCQLNYGCFTCKTSFHTKSGILLIFVVIFYFLYRIFFKIEATPQFAARRHFRYHIESVYLFYYNRTPCSWLFFAGIISYFKFMK